MNIFDNAYKQGVAKRAPLGDPIEIEEWGKDGEPAKVYIFPITLREYGEIARAAMVSEGILLTETLYQCAKNADGERHFRVDQKDMIADVFDPEVVTRVVDEINVRMGEVSQDAAVKD